MKGVSHDQEIRAVSEVMFKQRYRLELMVAIAEDPSGLVCLTDIAKQLDVTPSNLQGPIKDLKRAGLLTPMPKGDSRRLFYRRNPSHAWAFARELASSAAALQIDSASLRN
jgi:DNA-binding MarR family transcriptional regulator